MPSIGALNFLTMTGRIKRPRQTVEEMARPGADGLAFRWRGTRAEESVIKTVSDIVASQADTFETAVLQLVGTVVSVIDGFGTRTDNVAVKGVEIQKRASALFVGGSSGNPTPVVFEISWRLQAAGGSV